MRPRYFKMFYIIMHSAKIVFRKSNFLQYVILTQKYVALEPKYVVLYSQGLVSNQIKSLCVKSWPL